MRQQCTEKTGRRGRVFALRAAPAAAIVLALGIAAYSAGGSGVPSQAGEQAPPEISRPRAAASPQSQPAGATALTILLVRHAEREPTTRENPDPPLTDAGRRRAHAQIEAVGRAGIDAIYTTQFRRTRQTAEPLARHLKINPIVATAGGDAKEHARELARRVLTEHCGGVVLVVGHSDTLPALMAAFGVASPPSIGQDQFDSLFAVIAWGSGEPSGLVQARYGP